VTEWTAGQAVAEGFAADLTQIGCGHGNEYTVVRRSRSLPLEDDARGSIAGPSAEAV
jgi:hypothetical protein